AVACTGVDSVIFFFQAEDGIRDDLVTGVQTCALPISRSATSASSSKSGRVGESGPTSTSPIAPTRAAAVSSSPTTRRKASRYARSEERRVGKECRARGSSDKGHK